MKRPTKGFSMLGKKPTGGLAHAGEGLQHTFSFMRRHATEIFLPCITGEYLQTEGSP
jgi:hypothetical protein